MDEVTTAAIEVENGIKQFDQTFQSTLVNITVGNKKGYLSGLAVMKEIVERLEKYENVANGAFKQLIYQRKYMLNKLTMELYLVEQYQLAFQEAAMGNLERLEFIERNFKPFKFEYIKIE